MKFKDYQFKPEINEALLDLGFDEPTEVQEYFIPKIRKGKSVIGQSQTGTGKTHTFLLPLFQNLDESAQEVQVVITAPSRELAGQINQAAEQLARFTNTKVGCYIGGTDKKRQIEKLHHQQPQVVIGTPGRVLDLINENALKVHTAFAFVVDEADMTLDLGFLGEVDAIAARLPHLKQMLVFSATIPEKLRPFLRKYMNQPVVGDIQPKQMISPYIENLLVSTKGRQRNQLIYQLLTMGNPYLAIVFANTKERADEICRYLKHQGLKVALIHGGIAPRERRRVMKQIQNLDYQYVVATDLAARGIDIEGVSLVINDEIPTNLEFFIHRVGRTGRNQMKGTAITLYGPDDDQKIAAIENLGIQFEPKTIKDGELVTTFDRNRRQKRVASQQKLDPTMIGMVKKTKKKVKPGYKKKIKKNIADDRRQKRRAAEKQANRQRRKARKQQHQ